MNKRVILFLILFFIFFLISLSIFIYQSKIFLKTAKADSTSFSRGNSYVFVNPLQAAANGQEIIRITVFVLDARGLGIQGKQVILSENSNLQSQPVNSITDEKGKAVFDLSSIAKGEYLVSVTIDSIELIQKARLSFL